MTQRKSNTLLIEGGHRLHGTVAVSGSKNATLGAMAAALTVPEDCVLQNVPDIGDVEQMAQVLRSLGERCIADASKPVEGTTIFADYPSVLGTQNLMLAAATARGRTRIVNAAAEPEVQGTAQMLIRMGARISGAGTHTVEIEGVESLRGCEFEIIPDRLEAGTYAVASALTQGEVEVRGACPEHLESLTHKLREAGVQIEIQGNTVWARGVPELRPLTIQALPYPGLATDLQALVAVLLTQAHGVSYVHERVFDNRLLYAGELRKMGADVVTTGTTTAIISGPTSLHGSRVQALDVRAGAPLILARLAAVSGRSEGTDMYHLDPGYESLDV